LQARSIPLLAFKGVSPSNSHKCRDGQRMVRKGDVATHNDPSRNKPIAEQSDSALRYVLCLCHQYPLWPLGGFNGGKQSEAHFRKPRKSWGDSLLFDAWNLWGTQSEAMFKPISNRVNRSYGLIPYQVKKLAGSEQKLFPQCRNGLRLPS